MCARARVGGLHGQCDPQTAHEGETETGTGLSHGRTETEESGNSRGALPTAGHTARTGGLDEATRRTALHCTRFALRLRLLLLLRLLCFHWLLL